MITQQESSRMIMDSPDVLRLVFEQLAGDDDTLCAVGLTCHAWRTLSHPALLQFVDLSCHNRGRLHEFDDNDSSVMPVVYADYSARFRPKNLVPRQHAFIHLMLTKPELRKYVKALTWTFVWENCSGSIIADIDRHTWEVFHGLKNVTRLDLASLHEDCDDDYIRQIPDVLFPSVKDLRLSGWMHRRLVRVLLGSLDIHKLQSLKLDNLLDEGSLPDGRPMYFDVAEEWSPTGRKTSSTAGIDDDLYHRQENGEAFIFPGPMWLPLRILTPLSPASLSHLEVQLAPFNMELDLRSYHTLFRETANLMVACRETLKSLVIVSREDRSLYKETRYVSRCGTGAMFMFNTVIPWLMRMAVTFLTHVLEALDEHSFPVLEPVRCEGFHFLEEIDPSAVGDAHVFRIFELIRNCRVQGATFTEISRVDYRPDFCGIEGGIACVKGLETVLANS